MTPLTLATLQPRNTQPTEGQVFHPGGFLDVINYFLTIQGEGPFAGCPAVFVRLAGCNLSAVCRGCDTDYTAGRHQAEPIDLVERIKLMADGVTDLVVITGGEPFRQNITPLTNRLLNAVFEVQVETNGTLFLAGFPYDHRDVTLVCSPKTPLVHEYVKPFLNHLKYVLRAGEVDEKDGLPSSSLGSACRPWRYWEDYDPTVRSSRDPDTTVWVQPQDDGDPAQNAANVQAAVESCLKYGYRLCLQQHKIANLP